MQIHSIYVFSSPEPSVELKYTHAPAFVVVRYHFSKISSETTLPIKAKVHVEGPWERGTKFYINGPGHVAKMVKTFKYLLLQNWKSYNLETWHATSGTRAFINSDHGFTMTYFTTRSNLVASAFEWGNFYNAIEWEKHAANY